MMARHYQPGSLRGVGNSAAMSRAMQQVAQTGQQWAEATAPRDTGEYARSFRVRPATLEAPSRTGQGEPRAGAVLENTAPYAGVVEWRDGVLSRAVNVIEGQG